LFNNSLFHKIIAKIHIDIRDTVSPEMALECVKQVVKMGKISGGCTMYCYATELETSECNILVWTNPIGKQIVLK
jgi:hypothetical protein